MPMNLWAIPGYLCAISHVRLLRPGPERKLNRMDRQLYAAGRVGSAK